MKPTFRFAVDASLGKLARHLRMAGFDACYPDRFVQPHSYFTALDAGRTILTRTRSIRDRFQNRPLIFIHSNDPLRQLNQVIKEMGINVEDLRPFTRCIECNRETVQADREAIWGKIPSYVWQTHRRFLACEHCQRIYWAGSHRQHMTQRLSALSTLKRERNHER